MDTSFVVMMLLAFIIDKKVCLTRSDQQIRVNGEESCKDIAKSSPVLDLCYDDAVFSVSKRTYLDASKADSDRCYCFIKPGESSKHVGYKPNVWFEATYELGDHSQFFEIQHKETVNKTDHSTFIQLNEELWSVLAYEKIRGEIVTIPACLSIVVFGGIPFSLRCMVPERKAVVWTEHVDGTSRTEPSEVTVMPLQTTISPLKYLVVKYFYETVSILILVGIIIGNAITVGYILVQRQCRAKTKTLSQRQPRSQIRSSSTDPPDPGTTAPTVCAQSTIVDHGYDLLNEADMTDTLPDIPVDDSAALLNSTDFVEDTNERERHTAERIGADYIFYIGRDVRKSWEKKRKPCVERGSNYLTPLPEIDEVDDKDYLTPVCSDQAPLVPPRIKIRI